MSYKFIISPDTSSASQALINPDASLNWSDVEAVIAFDTHTIVHPRHHQQQTHHTQTYPGTVCPICLSSAVLPVITQCGHVFCFTCILRYLADAMSRKCPMCNGVVARGDLRAVLYDDYAPPSTIQTGSVATFVLLVCPRGCAAPTRMCPGSNPTPALPLYMSENAAFSRVSWASPAQLRKILEKRLTELDMFRLQCLESGRISGVLSEGVGDVEYLPVIPEAREILEDRLRSIQERKGTGDTAPVSSGTERPLWMYQHSSGAPAFLHPLCVRGLQRAVCSGEREGVDAILDNLPLEVSSLVVGVESDIVTVETRRRYPFTRHLPLDCPFFLVEVDMTHVVPPEVLAELQGEINARAASRAKLERERRRTERREWFDKQRADKQEIEDRKQRVEVACRVEKESLESLLNGPALSNASQPDSDSVPITSPPVSTSTPNEWGTFSRITQMGGNFPSLHESQPANVSIKETTAPAPTPGPWGRVGAEAWGPKASTPREVPQPTQIQEGGGKKGRSRKKQALFSNSSNRSYR